MSLPSPRSGALLAASLLLIATPLAKAIDDPTPAAAAARARDAAIHGDWQTAARTLSAAALRTHDPALDQAARDVARYADRTDQQRRKNIKALADDVQRSLDHSDVDGALAAAAPLIRPTDPPTPIFNDLVARATAAAADDENAGRYVSATRTYDLLDAIAPRDPARYERAADARRRAAWMFRYAPDELVRLEKLTGPLAGAGDYASHFAGVQPNLIVEAFNDTLTNYRRTVDYPRTIAAAIKILRSFLTTPGLAQTFPTLNDPNRLDPFLDTLDMQSDAARTRSDPAEAARGIKPLLDDLLQSSARTIALPDEILLGEFGDALAAATDEHTHFIWPADVKRVSDLHPVGIGVQLLATPRGITLQPLPDSPAARAGVLPNDQLLAIDQRTVISFGTPQFILPLLSGTPGSTLQLTVQTPGSPPRTLTIQRAKAPTTFTTHYVTGWNGNDQFLAGPSVAYLRVSHFDRTVPPQLGIDLQSAAATGARAIVLDLRHNSGGALDAATQSADLFLNHGTILATRAERPTPIPPTSVSADIARACDLPLVVLIDNFTSAAAEVVADALRRHANALLVGERTPGSGSLQTIFPLSSGLAYLQLPTSAAYAAGDHLLERQPDNDAYGVQPDLSLPTDTTATDSTTAPDDDQLTAALLLARLTALSH